MTSKHLPDCSIKLQGVPNYVPQKFRNVALTADMAMEKIMHISPTIHFYILRESEFFMVDRLMIFKTYYEPAVTAPLTSSPGQEESTLGYPSS